MPNMHELLHSFDHALGYRDRIDTMLRRILRALVRVLIRQRVTYVAFAELAKQAYVEVATSEFGLNGQAASKSRTALLTGLNRRDVARVQDRAAEREASDLNTMLGPAFRLVSAWIRSPDYLTADGQPSALALDGPAPSFDALQKTCCPDLPAKAVLRELQDSGIVSASNQHGCVELLNIGFIPRADTGAKVDLLGTDVSALIHTVGHNIASPHASRFQRKVSYTNLTDEGVSKLESVVAEHGQALLRKLDIELAEYVANETTIPSSISEQSSGHFAGLGMYVFIDSHLAPPPTKLGAIK